MIRFGPARSHATLADQRVPQVLPRQADTWDFGVFDAKGQITRGPGRNGRMGEVPGKTTVPVTEP